jgi:Reverse transcriptase (RNA-dependent DNA polymerase)
VLTGGTFIEIAACAPVPVDNIASPPSISSRVVPIFKQGDPTVCDNYRPVALVSTFSKILEKMVATDFFNHLDLNNLLYEHQYGFQRRKNTEHNLIQVVNYIGKALNEGNWCIGIFLDLKKAFDTVQHDILLKN